MAQKRKKKDNKTNEIVGVIVIGMAIFAAITVYFNIDSIFGTVIKNFIFGMCGVLGYLIPLLLGVVGVLIIAARSKTANYGKLALTLLTVFFVFSLVHISVTEATYGHRSSWGEFIANSYTVGKIDLTGGGAVGSLLTYWTYRYLRIAGSYIVCIIGIVACILSLTNLSLKKITKDIGHVVKNTYEDYRVRAEQKRVEQEERELYIESLNQEEQEFSQQLKEDPFDYKIRTYDEENTVELGETENVVDEPQFDEVVEDIEEYDPEPYREVFADTDIEFDDEVKPDTRSRRKIDLSKDTMTPEPKPQKVEEDTVPVQRVVEKGKGQQYIKPPVNLLSVPDKPTKSSASDLRKNAEILEETLESFNVEAKVVNVSHGPVVTRYEVQPAPGVKVSRIVNLSDDIAMNLAARDVRIEAPVPGKPVVGIEIPNQKRAFIGLRELISTKEFRNLKSPVAFGLGKDIAGNNVYADIAKMPHVLIAGATGSGKSVCINSLIVSILYHSPPEDVRMIMIDPKVVELNAYNEIPHLLIPVVTDPKKASSALNWAVNEMTMRYKKFAQKGAKELEKYNEAVLKEGEEKLPHILVIVDELADLMMVAPGEVEDAICRIAQLGRAAGIHLVIATQRPSVDVITGIIKANIPSRIAFSVSSQIDSRTILDMQGAEKLIGQGDMLFYPTGLPKPIRLQGCFISDKEVRAVTDFLKERTEAEYDTRVLEGVAKHSAEVIAGQDEQDELYMKAIETILEYDQASTSMLQRRLRIGYARAARIIDQLEDNNIVSPADGSRPREVLISKETFKEMQEQQQTEGYF